MIETVVTPFFLSAPKVKGHVEGQPGLFSSGPVGVGDERRIIGKRVLVAYIESRSAKKATGE